MIKQLHIQNFKSILDLCIFLNKVTLLIGASGAGKTNIWEALKLTNRNDALTIRGSDKQMFHYPHNPAVLCVNDRIYTAKMVTLNGDDGVMYSVEYDKLPSKNMFYVSNNNIIDFSDVELGFDTFLLPNEAIHCMNSNSCFGTAEKEFYEGILDRENTFIVFNSPFHQSNEKYIAESIEKYSYNNQFLVETSSTRFACNLIENTNTEDLNVYIVYNNCGRTCVKQVSGEEILDFDADLMLNIDQFYEEEE